MLSDTERKAIEKKIQGAEAQRVKHLQQMEHHKAQAHRLEGAVAAFREVLKDEGGNGGEADEVAGVEANGVAAG